MRINAAAFSRLNFNTSPYRSAAQPDAQVPGLDADALRGELRDAIEGTSRLTSGLKALRRAFGSAVRSPDGAVHTSSRTLGLDETSAKSSLRSSEEVTTTGRGSSRLRPRFDGASSSRPTIRGQYTGEPDAAYSIEVLDGGRLGGKYKPSRDFDVTLRVLRDDGSEVRQIQLDRHSVSSEQYELEHGLRLQLGGGTFASGDAASFDVTRIRRGNAHIDTSFRDLIQVGIDNDQRVRGGSIYLNGERIRITADDTIRSVLQKITDSDAGVHASYDAATESVTLESKTDGDHPIELTRADGTGFFAAMKLDPTRTVRGRIADSEQVLDNVAAFSGLRSGTVTVAGADIEIDTSTDSLRDVLARINAADNGVSAYLSRDRVVLRSASPQGIEIDEQDTGMLEAFGLGGPSLMSGGALLLPEADVTRTMAEVARSLDGLLAIEAQGSAGATLAVLQAGIESAVRSAADSKRGGKVRTGFGLDFQFGEGKAGVEFGDKQRAALKRALTRDPQQLLDFFTKKNADGDTLMDQIDGLVADAEAKLNSLEPGSLFSGSL